MRRAAATEAFVIADSSSGAPPRVGTRPSPNRRDAILAAACEHFGRHGFRGASLRDIARDAGVSLTLLNHHFGDKAGLLSAVVIANRPILRQRADALERLRKTGLGAFDLRDLVHAWAGAAFDAAERREGLQFLRLVARMMDDTAPETATLRRQMDDASVSFIDALTACYPHASRRAAATASLCVSACLLRCLTSDGLVATDGDAGRSAMTSYDRAGIERLLVAGIDAMLAVPGGEVGPLDAVRSGAMSAAHHDASLALS